jgi:hypothetical protein
MQHRFGVAARMEKMTEILKFSPQFLMIVDFAIEDYDAIPVIAQDGLVPGLSVYNLEACRAKRDKAGLEDPLMVWSTMDKRGRHTADSLRIRRPIAMRKAYDSAQTVILPFSQLRRPRRTAQKKSAQIGAIDNLPSVPLRFKTLKQIQRNNSLASSNQY